VAEYVRAVRGTPAGGGALFHALTCAGVTPAAAARFAGLERTLAVLGSAALRWLDADERLGRLGEGREAVLRGIVTRGTLVLGTLRLPPKLPPLRRAASASPPSRARVVSPVVRERFSPSSTRPGARKLRLRLLS